MKDLAAIGLFSGLLLATANAELPAAKDTATIQYQQHTQAAEAYFMAAGYDQDIKIELSHAIATISAMVAHRGGSETPDIETKITKITKIITRDFEAFAAERKQLYIDLFRKYFSTNDLDELVKLAETPLGRRFAAIKGSMISDIYERTEPAIKALYAQTWMAHKAEFIKIGLAFAGSKAQ